MLSSVPQTDTITIKYNRKKNIFYSDKVVPYIFVLPFIISFLTFYLYSIISTIMMSFQTISGLNDVEFVGLKNYMNLNNPHFFNALTVSAKYTFFTLLVLIPLPMLLAVVLNSKMTIGRNFFRSTLFIPALTSVIVAGIFFRYSFGEQETTLANAIIKSFGIGPIVWLQSKSTAIFILVVLATWRWLGVNIVYFLSGLQGISSELYESAEIDGANTIDKFFKITIPCLKPVIIYVVTISVYAGFAMFAESFAYWRSTPPGDIGLTLVGYIYQEGFNNNDLGFASAIGITLLAIVFVLNLIQLTLFGFFKKESD
ncbi:sugar ABC transporter permease [Petroclostridium xylanilyticum]|uniref:carbohydrate ABC transporter permease n=1 Tax=Petroclostridium xylanilyticum TaxID=1792311 RepID=UPI003119F0F7